MAMTVGEVKAVLSADIKGLQKGLSQAQSELKSFASSLAGPLGALGKIGEAAGPAGLAVAAGLGAATAAVTGLGAAIIDITKSFAAFGSHIQDLSERTGVSAESLQKLGYAGSLVGVSMDEIGQAAGFMSKNIAQGDDVFRRLGLSLDKLKAQAPDQQFAAIAAEIVKLPTAAMQTAAAMEVFGRAGARLLPLMKSDMAAAAAEAERLGIVLSNDTVNGADAIDDAMTKLGATWTGFLNNLAAGISESGGFADAINSAADFIGRLSQALNENEPFMRGMVDYVKQMIDLGEDWAAAIAKPIKAMGMGKVLGIGLSPAEQEAVKKIAQWDRDQAKLQRLIEEQGKAGYGPQAPSSKTFASSEQLKKAAEDQKKYIKEVSDNLKKMQEETAITDQAFQEMTAQMTDGLKRVEDAGIAAARAVGLIGAAMMPGLGPEKDAGPTSIVSPADMAAAVTNGEKLNALARDRDKKLEDTHLKLEANKDASIDWSQELANVAHSFQLLGISADSVLGKLLGGITAGAAAVKGLDLKGKTGGFSLTGGGGFGGLLKNLSGGMQLASAAVGIGKAIFGLFHKSPAEKAAEAAGKMLGMKVSKELAETIAKTAKDKNVSMALASLLNIGAAMKESGRDPREFAKQIGDLMNATKSGAVPAADGIAAIGDAFGQVAESALKAGSIGDKALVSLIQRSRELGLKIPEISQFVSEQLSQAAEGVSAMVSGMTPTTQAAADAEAAIFAGTFWATLKEKGMVGAAEVFGPVLEDFKKQLEAAGMTVPAVMGEIQDLINIGSNEKVKGASGAAAGVGQMLTGMGNAGFMTQDMLNSSSTVMADLMKQMMAGGATEKQSLEMLAPLLSQILNATQNAGKEVPPEVQEMLKQMEANGITVLEDPVLKQTGYLKEIRDAIVGGKFAGAGAPGSGSPVPGYADGSGGIKDFGTGTMAMLHGEEGVFTKDQISKMVGGTTTISPSISVAVTSASDPTSIANAVIGALKANTGGLIDQINRSQAGLR